MNKMESLKETVSVRIARLNAEIIGKAAKLETTNLFARESLLDALQSLYEECCLENLQKYDSNIAQFVKKYKNSMKELKLLRVNLADFEIKSVIGRGQFGEVHLVKEKQTGDVYAMKTLKKLDCDTKRTSFEEERNIMACSNSPWLTSLQYAFQDNACLFFIMEFHPGGDLLAHLYRQGGTLPESAATFYIAELVLALEDLHKMGYVHRDLKPDNVLFDRCGHLKLADFGSAAKLDKHGLVTIGPPVGTPDYIAPEVLQCLDNKNDKNQGYGVSCDFWSLGIVAYELTIGNTPFKDQSHALVYSKIMNPKHNLKFPPDVVLSQAYVGFIKNLVTDPTVRMGADQIRKHDLFKTTDFDTLRDQVPPFVPKITSVEDTSNFTEIQPRRYNPSVESFKKKTQFSGRNLPFIGFTYTHDPHSFESGFDRKIIAKDEVIEGFKSEVESLRRKLVKNEDFDREKSALEKRLEEKDRKLNSVEKIRDKLENELCNGTAEIASLKRTLELEKKERAELEIKALDLIKGAKLKWEMAEKTKIEKLTLQVEQQREKITQLTTTNNMLNEQLQHALKLENKHKESLEKVENLSRRSVVGLECRLEKITSETQGTIAELQRRLSEETHQKSVLERKLGSMKDNETTLQIKLKQSETEYDSLKEKVHEAESLMQQLSDQVTSLQSDVGQIETYKKEIARLQEIVDKSHKTVKDLENRNTSLHIEAKALDDYKKEVENMKKTIANMQNDRKLVQLESQLYEEREKCQELKKQLKESESIVTENQELKELRTKYWRMEKDFGNCKIDKRILERELKDAQAEIKTLNTKILECNDKLSESKKVHESAILELGGINESISMELMKVTENYKNLQDILNMEKEKANEEKIIVQELKDIIKTKDAQLRSLESEMCAFRKDKSVLENEIHTYETEKSKLLGLAERLQKEKSDICDELHKVKREVDNKNLNLDALREACMLLESQVVEYQKLNESFQEKQKSLNSNTEKLIQDVCKAKEEVQDARKQVNEEKSLRLLAETKIKRLLEDVQGLRQESDAYKKQCMEYKECAGRLSDELGIAEEKVLNLEMNVTSYQRQIEDLRKENKAVKQEMSDYLTKLHKVKEANYKLNHQLKESNHKGMELAHELNALTRVVQERSVYFKERELKSDSTIQQQIKLIDYLQTKIDELNNRKKTFTEVLFGSSKKENQPPPPILNYKDLETQLQKERETNKQLNEELCRVKAASMPHFHKTSTKVQRHKSEIISPRSKLVLEQIVNSPSKQKNELYRQNSLQRMHHNIPHRFESKLCVKSSTKCACCSESITLGRSMSVCKECNITTHSHCTGAIPNTCGLPRAYANHYKDSLEVKTEEATALDMSEDGTVNVEGWIKTPSKNGSWEKCYGCLTDVSIKIYTGPPNGDGTKPVQDFPLKPANSHGKVILEPIPSEIGIPVANSDLPFVLKVEVAPDTTCWPQKCLIFMALSAQDKDKWFMALQKIYCEDFGKVTFDKVLTLPDEVEVNCFVELTDSIKLIGTERGLYTYHEGNLVHVEALSSVHHISVIPNTNSVVMIVNSKSTLIISDLNHLINIAQCAQFTKPKLKYVDVNVNNLNGFHLLQVSKFPAIQKVCVATPKQLVILNYDMETSDLVPQRVLDTAEPTSCALFTENTLIVGADKFFEIDLQSYQAEEFLDLSDTKLKQAGKCYKMGSFPLAILQISKNPKEYLLCFNEFSVFVDEYGRSSRDGEIKATHLPIAFHFSKPYLYVVQFAAIEITRISEDTCNDDSITTHRLEVDKFKFVGCNKKGIYIVQTREIKFVDAKKFVDVDGGSSIASESTENESDRFSFTSSIVQSLDGNLSDSDSAAVDTRAKRVQFSESTSH